MYVQCSRCAHESHRGSCTKVMARGIRCSCKFAAQMDLCVTYGTLQSQVVGRVAPVTSGRLYLVRPSA